MTGANPMNHNSEETPPEMDVTPGDAASYFARGLNSAKLGFPDSAAKDFEEAAWLDPENAEIQFNLGTAYLSMGMFEQALSNLSKAVDLEPAMTDAWGNRAVAYAALGDDAKSERDVERAVSMGAPPDGLETVISYVKSKRRPTPGP